MPDKAESDITTLSFEVFWAWLRSHRNCILRVGTPYSILMDHDDYHWDVVTEDEDTQVVQLLRAKDLVGEVIVLASEIAYVQCVPTESEEQLFECIVETPHSKEILYHFLLSHGYEDEAPPSDRWTH